jgi:hypothetical protein
MDRKLKIVIPVIAGVVAIGSGVGVAFARNDQPQVAQRPNVSYDTASDPTTQPETTTPYYCGGYGYGMMGYGYGAGFGITQQLADLLNSTPADIQARLQSGATLMDLASEQGVTQDQLVEAVMGPFNDHIDLMIKYGYVSQDDATTLRQRVRDQVQTMVNTPNGEQSSWWDYMDQMMDDYGCPGFGRGPNGTTPDESGTTTAPGYGPGGMMGGYGYSSAPATGRSGYGGMMGGFGGGFGGMMR